MIGQIMSQEQSLEFVIPTEFNQVHHNALMAYLSDSRGLDTDVWRLVYEGIDLLAEAQVSNHSYYPNLSTGVRRIYWWSFGEPIH